MGLLGPSAAGELPYTRDVDAASVERALAHRLALPSVTFVAITGSCGKTTTKDLATGMVAGTRRGTSNPGSGNCGSDIVRLLLQVDPAHEFCIQELGAWGPGTLDEGLGLIRPDIGVVLNVRRDHYSGFGGLTHAQAEKTKVVTCLPAHGTAILNVDDALVRDMRHRTRATVVTFGLHHDADFAARDVSGDWPDRVQFTLLAHGTRHHVRTQLVSEHLIGSALAALAIAYTLGVPVEQAVERLATLPPSARRMSADTIAPGIAVVRDDFKATSDSLGEVLDFLARARAARKVLVVGRISDYPGRSRRVYTAFAAAAVAVVDLLVFVGERPEGLWGGPRRGTPEFLAEFSGQRARVELCATVQEAGQFVSGYLQPGDLLVLKASGPTDHLERVALMHQTDVRCWRAHCGQVLSCDACALLDRPAHSGDALPEAHRAL
jgi:UDP-N-acetylmuramoyl-tripeptide--D-alanyl-D-alanine ligase